MKTTFLLIVLLLVQPGYAQVPLSKQEVYSRCYEQITKDSVPENDPNVPLVNAGVLDPIVACLNVFDRAAFTVNQGKMISNKNDPEAINVLKAMNNLHRTWISVKDTYPSAVDDTDINGDYNDPGDTALYFTRALFDSNTPFSYVVTANENLIADRSVPNPSVGPKTGTAASATIFGALAHFAPIGILYGVKVTGTQTVTTKCGTNHNWGQHYGGGAMGTRMYQLMTVDGPANTFKSDGATQLPRKWAKALFADFMCRDIPVIRDADSAPFVAPTSVVPFRVSTACTKCHASMDRMSSVIRGFQYKWMYTGAPGCGSTDVKPMDVFHQVPSMTAETQWPVASDPNYFRRPTNGNLYYRSYDGALVDVPVTGLADLGSKMAAQNDIYVCAAKRYYKHFTGIDADVTDIADPNYGKTLSSAEQFHRNRVISYGLQLKSHQKSRKLIEDILNSPEYRTSNFGIQ